MLNINYFLKAFKRLVTLIKKSKKNIQVVYMREKSKISHRIKGEIDRRAAFETAN